MSLLPPRALLRNLFLDLAGKPFRSLGLVLVVAGASAFKSGVGMAMDGIGSTLERFYARTGFADLEIRIMPDDLRNLPGFSGVPGLLAWEPRLVMPSQIARKSGGSLAGLLILRNPSAARIDSVQITQGSSVEPDGGRVIMDRSLAAYQGFGLGDVIASQVGERTYRDTIVAIGTSPEFFCSASNPDFALPEKGSLGVVFGSLDRIRDALGFTLVNDLVFRFEPGADPAAVRASILGRLKGANLEKVTPRQEHFSHKNIMLRVRNYRMYSGAIIWTLLALALAVSAFTFSRMILEQRGQIGLLASLGYSRGVLAYAYLLAAGALGAIASPASLPIALFLRNVFVGSFAKANGLAFVDPLRDPLSLAFLPCACLALALLGMALPLYRLLRLPPIRIIRAGVPQMAGINPAGWAGRTQVTSSLPLGARFGLRNFARTPFKSSVGVAVLGFAIGVPISYGLSRSSSMGTMLEAFRQEHWDLAVDFLHPMFEEDLDSLRALGGKLETYFRYAGEICVRGRCLDARLLGIDPEGVARPTRVAYGRPAAAPRELVCSKDIADELGAAPGDSLTLNVNQQPFGFRLAGVTSDIFTRQLILPLRTAREISQFEGKATGAYLVRPGAGPARAKAWEKAALVTTKPAMLVNLYERWRASAGIVYVTTAFSLLMAVIYAMMTTNLEILERKREYATLLSLGYGFREIGGIIFCEVALQFLLASAVAVPIGIGLAYAFNAEVGTFWFEPKFHARFADFAIPLAAIAAVVPAVAYAGYRRIVRMDVGSELRYREIG